MERLLIHGNNIISGETNVQGSKNAALSLLMASLVVHAKSYISNVPDIDDVREVISILRSIGVNIEYNAGVCKLAPYKFDISSLDFNASSNVRYSVLLLGGLVGRVDKVKIPPPGGCSIGLRRIDIHLDAFRKMGAKIQGTDEWIEVDVRNLHSAYIKMRYPSDTGTVNIILAACNISGRMVIENASISPETVQVCRYLNQAGINISGIGTSQLSIHGRCTRGVEYSVMTDRLAALTYMIAALVTHGNIKIKNFMPTYLTNEINALKTIGADIEQVGDDLIVQSVDTYKPCDISGGIYPEFHTDAVPLFVPLLLQANGESVAKDLIFNDRFKYIEYLNNMGANISIHKGDWQCPSGEYGQYVRIKPTKKLHGRNTIATDLRGGVALVLAALSASNISYINNIEHIFRGYENFIHTLVSLGAKMEIVG